MFIGIDLGLGGAISSITNEGVKIFDTPIIKMGTKRIYDINKIIELMNNEFKEVSLCFLEKGQAMPGQGVVSMFSIGYGMGVFNALLTYKGINFQTISPQSWKKEFNLIGQEKNASIVTAQRLFPDNKDMFYTPRGSALNGRSDSLLIAEFARRKYEKD